MAEVLEVDVDAGASRALGVDELALDPATTRMLEQAVADAHERGRREGEQQGRAAVSEQLAQLGAAVRADVEALRADLAAQREEATRASLELARAAATAVLDATPPDDALALLDRVAAAIELLDDDPLRVSLHPEDHATVTEAVGEIDGVELVADRRMRRGEASVTGPSAGAEVTRQALLTAALDALGEAAA